MKHCPTCRCVVDERKTIIIARWLSGEKMAALAREFEISPERVRQIIRRDPIARKYDGSTCSGKPRELIGWRKEFYRLKPL